VLHEYVDKASHDGNVYVKCASIQTAVNSVQSLHGRWFAGMLFSEEITFVYIQVRVCDEIRVFVIEDWMGMGGIELFQQIFYIFVFAGKVITANYVPVPNYHQLFPECARVTEPLQPSFATLAAANQQHAGNIY
jgi:hypothetical protein